MKNIFEQLTNLLKKDERLTSQDGVLLKNQTQELARKNDSELIKLLLSDKAIKQHFFFSAEGGSASGGEVSNVLIFDKEKFIRFISNKQFLPDSYTAFKNKIGLTAGDEYMSESKEVVLVWPYKDCVLEGGMTKEDQKRDEIFYNETLAPDDINRLLDAKVFTNFKRIDKKGERKLDSFNRDEKGAIKDNLIIKGNNLLALASLKKEFAGKVKLIYIDPPYNTKKGSFNYNDSFNHSTWLVFMKNRLENARRYLKNDGAIAISCDDSEQAYLKVLCDDIFGNNNFVTTFFVQVRYEDKTLSEDNDYQKVMECIHIYAKDNKVFKPNKIKEEYSLDKFCYKITELRKGKEKQVAGRKVKIFNDGDYKIEKVNPGINNLKETWATGGLIRQGGTAAEFLALHLIGRRKEDGLKTLYKVYGMGADGLGYRYILGPQKESAFRGKFYSGVPIEIKADVSKGDYLKEKPIPNLLYNFFDFSAEFGNCRSEGGVDMGGGKKPEALISYLLEYFTNTGDTVLDFFAGSGTTGAVAHKMSRQYILIEQMDYVHDLPESRLINVINGEQSGISKEVNWSGGGDFVYMELAKWNEEWIEKIEKAKTVKELAKLWDEMKETAFLSYKVDPTTVDVNAKDFADLSIADQKKFLIECLDKNQLYVNLSEIEDKEYGVSKEDKELNKEFYARQN